MTYINPKTKKYYKNRGRCETTKKILGKSWRRSHLILAYIMKFSLEEFQKLLDMKFVVHHRDGNKFNDMPENLDIISNSDHVSIHNNGKHLTEEHKQKISNSQKGYHDIYNESIKQLIIQEGKTTRGVGEILDISYKTVLLRLKIMGYVNIGSNKKPKWILKTVSNKIKYPSIH